jgi:cation:H+ antiporter
MIVYILFVIGFALLIKGADVLVDGAASIAKRYHLSELVIGLTIVSFGTSMPELIVNLLASFEGSSELAIGNVFGSNIANVLLILGVSAIIMPLQIKRSIYFTEIPIMLVATFMVGFLANANLFIETQGLVLSRYDGMMLLFFFSLFMFYIFVISKLKPNENSGDNEGLKVFSIFKSSMMIVIGCIMLFLGGKWIVDGAIEISLLFGMSQTFIGLTVVAIGTSLPELVTSAMAAKRGRSDMAVGNVIGSNIFNLLWILGISALINPIPFDVASNNDILMIILSTTALILAIIIGKRPVISRWEGATFVLFYASYITYLVLRG